MKEFKIIELLTLLAKAQVKNNGKKLPTYFRYKNVNWELAECCDGWTYVNFYYNNVELFDVIKHEDLNDAFIGFDDYSEFDEYVDSLMEGEE